LLVDNCKLDLRMYVLVRSVSPLRLYVYEEGLCRLATCEYEKPASENQKNMKMHLTNYAINKTSSNFVFNKS
jgi:tubulin polyglutamylase TTLL6/13